MPLSITGKLAQPPRLGEGRVGGAQGSVNDKRPLKERLSNASLCDMSRISVKLPLRGEHSQTPRSTSMAPLPHEKPDPQRVAILRSLPLEIKQQLTGDEAEAFMYNRELPDSLLEKLKDYLVDEKP